MPSRSASRSSSPIPLFDPSAPAAPRILQLYQDLELYSAGEPPRNSLFVLGRTLAGAPSQGLWRSQLLIIDPPDDVTTRFRLEDDVAVLYTTERLPDAPDTGLPKVQKMPGGLAHLRVGEHFLDLYVQRQGVVVHFPALGIVAGGEFGSDLLPPRLAPGSDGTEELETLRLLARLVKAKNFQLYVPACGAMVGERMAAMERLAADVARLHGLERIGPGALVGPRET